MKNNINHINRFENKNGKTETQVYYNNGRVYRYSNDNLIPLTVLNFMLNDSTCETIYTNFGKKETYK